jgi:hypothetical protein
MLVKVWTELPNGRYATLLAKVYEHTGDTMTINYLSPTGSKKHGYTVYKYEKESYEVDDDSIIEYLEDMDETDIGYKKIEEGYIKYTSDSDYVPSESEPDSDDEDNYVEE